MTGIGVVAPCGVGAEALLAGPARDPARRAPAASTTGTRRPGSRPKEARRTDRFTQFAVAAATEALDEAGARRRRSGPLGAFCRHRRRRPATLEEQVVVQLEKGERRVSPFLVPMMMANAAAAAVSMRFGWQGPCETIVTACAAGTHAIGNAARLIASGRCDAVVTGAPRRRSRPRRWPASPT